MKIAIIIPFFGKWPEWIDLYFFSCSNNSGIDWFFLTDCDIPVVYSTNLHFQAISFSDYCQMAGRKLKFDFNPSNPYKLCGLRPFYGFIHQDLIQGYDYWGFGDVDIVWGNIKKFYTDEMFEKYDVFSSHADRISGHLAIIKNTKYYREVCFKIKDWKLKLQNPEAIALDEADFSWLIYPESKVITKIYSKVICNILNWRNAWVFYYNLVPIINFLLGSKLRRFYFKEQHTTPILSDDGLTCKHDADTWFYQHGKITNSKTEDEYIYLHFMIFKKNSFRVNHYWENDYFHVPSKINKNELIIIDKSGIYKPVI